MTATVDNAVADLQRANDELRRLLDGALAERDEALDQQTATAEVLAVINSSPGELTPVFDAILEKAIRLCGVAFGWLDLFDGERFNTAVLRGVPEEFASFRRQNPPEYGPGTTPARVLAGERVVHVADLIDTDAYRAVEPNRRAVVDLAGARTALVVPLMKDQRLLGLICVFRQQVRPFFDKQIVLLQNFAAQAVIAIENARLITETREALNQQTATAEVLRVINTSPGDLGPVFHAIVEKAHTLCDASAGSLQLWDGKLFRGFAMRGFSPEMTERLRQGYSPFDMPCRRIVEGENVVHIHDLAEFDSPTAQLGSQVGGVRTIIYVALRNEERLLGQIVAVRKEVRPFSDKEIALVENFAAQAVIAMANARLITETREALDQQTATAEVLQVINSSPGDLGPVFEAMLEKAMRLCEASFGYLLTYDGERLHSAADRGHPAFAAWVRAQGPIKPEPGTTNARLVAGEDVVLIPDVADDLALPGASAVRRAVIEIGGFRTMLSMALRRDEVLLGVIHIYRQEVRPFTEKQIALLQNFAVQAVIAMENARLITETREALDQQTATAEVLQVINSSPGNLQPVFEAMLSSALRLCGAAYGNLLTYESGYFHATAGVYSDARSGEQELTRPPFQPAPHGLLHRLLNGESIICVDDVRSEVSYRVSPEFRELVDAGGYHRMIYIALRQEDRLLGAIVIFFTEPSRVTDKQIALLENFAAQAVIAMENARLLTETREALAQQTATSEVLQVISRSTFDLDTVLKTVVSTARRLCRADYSVIFRNEGGEYRFASGEGNVHEYEERERLAVISPGRGTVIGRAVLEGRAVQILDALADPEYAEKDDARLGGARTMLGVPLEREGEVIGALGLARNRIEAFSDREVELVATFADQAVIAMENVRLITETREARDEAEKALRDLRAAQANLVQAEKMASLGQLTAGIAHEIKNPLNFVNNFAGLSVELLGELKETTAPAVAALGDDKRAEVDETMVMLSGNLDKIAEHGKRADNIVKSMLEHSRGVSGERRAVDLNNLIEEALNLAYHGARAQDSDFNITLERDYAPALPPIDLAPQEMTRVFLNLIGNGFYAASKCAKENGCNGYRPTLSVATREAESGVEVRVRDNGTGIPADARDKLFQPFFTTKPTGEGTGLGLSISYDIVTQQHGGSIEVASEEGTYTEFTIRLPRHNHPSAAEREA